jgi:ABC-type polysaccharide/polyol phosphate export permease
VFRILTEWWRFKTLLFALAGRQLRARYRGSILGFVWSFLNPLCLLAVYSLVFKYYIRFDDVEHYTLFMFAGLLPWIWFSSSLLESTGSISGGGSLVTKAMFPPHILPAVAIITNLVNFLLSIPLLLVFMWIAGVGFSKLLLFLPLIILIQFVFITGLGLALSAINVHYRDVQHILGNLMTLWFFLCPVVYPLNNIPGSMRFTILLNPVALFTEFYHLSFLGEGVFEPWHICFLVGISLLVFAIGCRIFNHFRETFSELV